MTTANIFDLADTWNDGATTFTAIKMDVTDTDSGAGSKLLDLQVGGVSQLSVSKTGAARATAFEYADGGSYLTPTIRAAAFPTTGFSFASVTNTAYIAGGTAVVLFGRSGPTPRVLMRNNADFGWGNADVNGSFDVLLCRDAPHTLAQRLNTNPQAFNIYNTFTDGSNYERARLGWAGNAFEIKPQAEGTGTTRTLHISGLPTSDPAINGVLWNDAGTVKVSAG